MFKTGAAQTLSNIDVLGEVFAFKFDGTQTFPPGKEVECLLRLGFVFKAETFGSLIYETKKRFAVVTKGKVEYYDRRKPCK